MNQCRQTSAWLVQLIHGIADAAHGCLDTVSYTHLTLPTALIVGFATAAQLAMADLPAREQQQGALRDQLWTELKKRLPDLQCNGAEQPRLSHNLNVTIPGVNGARLHRALRPHLVCSSGSACSNGKPSHVLQALGRSRGEAESSLRLSLGRSTTTADIQAAVSCIGDAVDQLNQPR